MLIFYALTKYEKEKGFSSDQDRLGKGPVIYVIGVPRLLDFELGEQT